MYSAISYTFHIHTFNKIRAVQFFFGKVFNSLCIKLVSLINKLLINENVADMRLTEAFWVMHLVHKS